VVGLLKKRKKAKKSHSPESLPTKSDGNSPATTTTLSNVADKIVGSVVTAPIAVVASVATEIGA
jgi:hypothetical protein